MTMSADGRGLVSQVGGVLLAEAARVTSLAITGVPSAMPPSQ
jgi:hypothetical protein